MPFVNHGEVTLTTYNDVAGNQINVYTTSAVASVALTAFRFGKPSIAPFSKFIDLLLEAQTAFQDITPLFPGHQSIRKLGVELSSILTNTTLVGLLVESILEDDWYSHRGLRFFQAITSRVVEYTETIQNFVGDVRLFREGLQYTSIGPLWRRVFWSIMWCLSSDITRIVEQALKQFVAFQRPLTLLIDALGKNNALHDRFIPAQSRQIFEQLFVNSSEVVHHLATPRATLNLFTGGYYVFPSKHYHPDAYELDICLEYFSSFLDLQSLVSNLSNSTLDLVDVSSHRLITAKTSELLAASTSSLKIQTVHKAYYISPKSMTNQCPRCDSLCNGSVSGWHVCPQCYLYIRHRNYQDVGFDTGFGTGASFEVPLLKESQYADWIHIDPQSLPRQLGVRIEPHLMEPLLHFMRSSPTDTLYINVVPKSQVGLSVFSLKNPRHDVIPNIKDLGLDLSYENILPTRLPNVSLPNLEDLSIWSLGGLSSETIATWVLSYPSIRALRFDTDSNDLWAFSSLLQLLPGLPLLRVFRFYGDLTPEELHRLYDHIQEMKLLGHPLEQLEILYQYCCCWDRLRESGVTVNE